MPEARLFAVASFSNKYDTTPRQQEPVTWEELVRRLTRHREWADQNGELWSPTEYRPGTTRANENVLNLDCFVLDMDTAGSWEPYTETWSEILSLAFVLYTTYHHTPEAPRWRVVFPLAQPVPGYLWTRVWERLAWGLARHQADPKCKEAARAYWMPSHPKGALGVTAFESPGAMLSIAQFTSLPPKPQALPPFVSSGQRVEPEELAERALDEARKHVSGNPQGRNAGLLWLLVQLRDNGYGQGESEALARALYLPRLWDTNTKGAHEPFTERNVFEVSKNVFGRGARAPWAKKREPAPVPTEQRTPDAPEVTLRADGFLEPTGAQILAAAYTSRELQQEELPPVRWIVEAFVSEGLTLLHGHSKLGKTFVGLDTAAAIALGGRALGKYVAEPGRVLYIAREDGKRRMKARLSHLFTDEAAWPETLHFVHDWPQMDQAGFSLLAEWLALHPDTRAIFMDPWTALRPTHTRGGDVVKEDRRPLERLDAIGHQHRLAFFVVHHSAQHDKGDALNNASGSSGVVQPCTCVYQFTRKRGEHEATLAGDHKDGPAISVTIQRNERTGFWTVIGNTEEVAVSRIRLMIFEYLSENGPAKPKALASSLQLPLPTVQSTVRRMEQDGEILGSYGTYRAVRKPGSKEAL